MEESNDIKTLIPSSERTEDCTRGAGGGFPADLISITKLADFMLSEHSNAVAVTLNIPGLCAVSSKR